MKKLKTCPFCGGTARTSKADPTSYDDYEAVTACSYCGASVPGYGTTQQEADKDSEEQWERRV